MEKKRRPVVVKHVSVLFHSLGDQAVQCIVDGTLEFFRHRGIPVSLMRLQRLLLLCVVALEYYSVVEAL